MTSVKGYEKVYVFNLTIEKTTNLCINLFITIVCRKNFAGVSKNLDTDLKIIIGIILLDENNKKIQA